MKKTKHAFTNRAPFFTLVLLNSSKNACRIRLLGLIFVDISAAVSERIFLRQYLVVNCHYASIFIVFALPTAEIIFLQFY